MEARRIGWAAAAVAVGVAVTAGAAGAATKAPPVAESAGEHVAHALAPGKVTIRQVLAYGRQNTWIAGVKMTERGIPRSGRGAKLRARLGGMWECEQSEVAWHRFVHFNLSSCDARTNYPTAVWQRTKGARLITDRGTVRVGQRWSAAPKALRSSVTGRERWTDRDGVPNVIHRIGQFQDVCGGRRPHPIKTGSRSPIAVHVGPGGRVLTIYAHLADLTFERTQDYGPC